MRSVGLFAIVLSLILCAGCSKDEKSQSEPSTPRQTAQTPKPAPSPRIIPKTRFTVIDIDKRSTTVTFKKKRIAVDKVAQPIILVNIFAAWSPPCRGMIPYLGDLQRDNARDLFVVGLMAKSPMSNEALRQLMQQHDASYFISNGPDDAQLITALTKSLGLDANHPVPLTILFYKGNYVTHYEGAAPIEMIQSDLKQLRTRR